MYDYVCPRCQGAWGAAYVAEEPTLCPTCKRDDEWAAMPLCSRCGQHRVGPKTHAAGGTLCQGCHYFQVVDDAQEHYEPVLSIVRDWTGYQTYVEQTGGMTMVACVYLPVGDTAVCQHCEEPIELVGETWLHVHGGSLCDFTSAEWHRKFAPDESMATPQEGYPQINFVDDQDEVWGIGYSRSSGDFASIDTSDLWVRDGIDPVGDHDLVAHAHVAATPEDVAARIILLIENPELAS